MIVEARRRRKPTASGVERPYPGDRVRFTLDPHTQNEQVAEGVVFDQAPGRACWVHGDDRRIHLMHLTTAKERREGKTSWSSLEGSRHAMWRGRILKRLSGYVYAYRVAHSPGGRWQLWHVDPDCGYAATGEKVEGRYLGVIHLIRHVKSSESLYSLGRHDYCPDCIAVV